MGTLINEVGNVYTRLTVVEYMGAVNKDTRATFRCQCICGNEIITTGKHLRSKNTRSCGCLQKDLARDNKENIIHGICYTRIYRIWSSIRTRIYNQKYHSYSRYGEIGITICEEWASVENFYKWAMENGYEDGLSIDRIDVYGNYEPSNCRWATQKIQANNRTNNIFITLKGETKTLSGWCEYYELNYQTVYKRYKKYGWKIEKALELEK
jgi:hypothetical protein